MVTYSVYGDGLSPCCGTRRTVMMMVRAAWYVMLVHLYFSVPRRNIRGAIFIFTCARCDVRVCTHTYFAEGELDDM